MDGGTDFVGIPAVDSEGRAFERHVIKRRPGRREAIFIGRTRLVDGCRWVEHGFVVKRVGPERAARLIARYAALADALSGTGVPEVPRVTHASAAEGWLALAAFPGAPLSAFDDGPARSAVLLVSATALARLEQDIWARDHWPDRRWTVSREGARLEELAREVAAPLPGFAAGLLDELERGGALSLPAHRDLNEEQIIASGDGTARWIDWDEAVLAPPGLDLGNLIAHEHLRALRLGGQPGDPATLLTAYFEAGGRATARQAQLWEAVACLRLAVLARRLPEGERDPEWVPVPTTDPIEVRRRAHALEGIAAELAVG